MNCTPCENSRGRREVTHAAMGSRSDAHGARRRVRKCHIDFSCRGNWLPLPRDSWFSQHGVRLLEQGWEQGAHRRVVAREGVRRLPPDRKRWIAFSYDRMETSNKEPFCLQRNSREYPGNDTSHSTRYLSCRASQANLFHLLAIYSPISLSTRWLIPLVVR